MKEVRSDLMGEIGKVRSEIKEVRSELTSEIKEIRTEMRSGFEMLGAKIDKSAAEGRAFSYKLFASTGAALTVFVGYQQLEEHKREERLGRMESFVFNISPLSLPALAAGAPIGGTPAP